MPVPDEAEWGAEEMEPVPVEGAGPGEEVPGLRYAWVQMGPGDTWIVRAVLDAAVAAECPAPMTTRAAPDSAFPVRVCEARLGRDVSHAWLAGRRWARPVDDPRAVALLGDTGCRVKGGVPQACDNAAAWPFARVAEMAAADRPELVVHVGDYHYRERCDSACDAVGPVGYGWDAWEADFFRPAAPLLEAAPWVMVRGNHESCARAGEGWFRLLDPAVRPDTAGTFCADFTEPYVVRTLGADLLILDSACAPAGAACAPADSTVATYARQLQALAAAAGPRNAWLVTHAPLWAVTDYEGPDAAGTASLQQALAAAGGALPPRVELHLAGHLHLFQALWMEGRPRVFIQGNGGTRLDAEPAPLPPGAAVAGAVVQDVLSRASFGYTVAVPDEGGWRMVTRWLEFSPPKRCDSSGGKVCPAGL